MEKKPQNNPQEPKMGQLPGQSMQKRKRTKAASEYKKSLVEKQALKNLYHLSEKQFKKYVKETLEMTKVENFADELIKKLERRLDSVVFRMGFAKSHAHARQMVSHSYFLVNGKPVNIPSFVVSRNDIVAVKEAKKKKSVTKDLQAALKKQQDLNWVAVNKEKFEGKVVHYPTLAEVNPPVELQLIFEFYSR